MTITKEVPVSLRLTRPEADDLSAVAKLRGEKPAALVARYVREGVRRSRFPAIELRDGEPGRVAYLAGTRWPVWLIVNLVAEHGGKVEKAARQMRRPAALVRMALAYARAYPEEIAACLRLQAERDFDGLKQILPSLERL
jgi:uncharacterized protein (DUF433 family)